MQRNIKKNVIIIYYVQLIMECISKNKKNQHYVYSMINDVKKVMLKVYQSIGKIWFCICIWKRKYVGYIYIFEMVLIMTETMIPCFFLNL